MVSWQEISDDSELFDIVVGCETEEDEDIEVPLVSIKFR